MSLLLLFKPPASAAADTRLFTLHVDWDNDGDYGDAGEDVTGRLQRTTCRRGRDEPSPQTGRATAGKLGATLLNTSGDYSRFNTSSPLYGQILPGRKVRLRSPVWGVDLWTGVLDNVEPTAGQGQAPTAELTASGRFLTLAATRPKPAFETDSTTGELAEALLDAAGWPAADRAIGDTVQTVDTWVVTGAQTALDGLRDLEATEAGFVWERGDGAVVFEGRYERALEHDEPEAVFSDQPTAVVGTFTLGDSTVVNEYSLTYTAISQGDPLAGVANEVTAEVRTYSTEEPAVLWTYQGETISLAPREVFEVVASYPGPSGPEGAYVTSWTALERTVDLVTTGVPETEIGIATVFASYAGNLPYQTATTHRIRLQNSSFTRVATILRLQARGIAATRGDAVTVFADDETSKETYGPRPLSLPAPWLPSKAAAQSYAEGVLLRTKDPRPTLTLTFAASRDVDHRRQAMQRDLSDRITVAATGTKTALGLAGDWFIEHIQHSITRDLHMVTYECSRADDEAWWVLGTDDLDDTTRLGF